METPNAIAKVKAHFAKMSKDESIVSCIIMITKFVNVCGILFYKTLVLVGLTGFFGICTMYLLYSHPQLWPLFALYLAWMFVDWSTPKQGGRKVGANFVGSLFPFRCMRDYYPISLVKTVDLDPKRNYIFGYHPHGFMPDGLVISFGTNLLGFQEKFPGITPHIGAHSMILKSPFYREIAMWLRVVDVGSESFRYILTQMGPGNSIALTPGGAAEMLDSYYKDYILTINRRKQFIKMALETGSSLVPVFGFGQNDSYQQPFFINNNDLNFEWLKSYKKSKPTALEKWSKVVISGTLISFGGNYIPGLPCNKPITVVVGSPIHVEKVTSPSDEQITQLHTLYTKELKQLFDNNRDKYGVPRDTKLIIQ